MSATLLASGTPAEVRPCQRLETSLALWHFGTFTLCLFSWLQKKRIHAEFHCLRVSNLFTSCGERVVHMVPALNFRFIAFRDLSSHSIHVHPLIVYSQPQR